MSEEINISEKSQSIKTDIEDCYRSCVRWLQLFKSAQRKHIGNEGMYFAEFTASFEALFIFTSVDSSIRKEEYQKGGLLTDRVEAWLNNGGKHRKEGEKLFLAYRKALFDRGTLSVK